MKRKLVAALACRVQGTRLYGKPLQNLETDYTIIDHIISCIQETPEIDNIVLGISEGVENHPFIEMANKYSIDYIIGDQKDVMWRLIQCGRSAQATDIFRITTECPFTVWEMLPDLWDRHINNNNDISVTDLLPEGSHFEIYTQEALERCHRDGDDADRSEYVSAYPRFNQNKFKIEIVLPKTSLQRMDLRLTVDYPEDLVVCRRIYENLKNEGPKIPLSTIIKWLDANSEVACLVNQFTEATAVWHGIPQRL